MLYKIKQKIESKRGSGSSFWILMILIKDFLWQLSEKSKDIYWFFASKISNFLFLFFEFFGNHGYDFDVDVVYVYADGDDPDFLKQKSILLKGVKQEDPLIKESTAPNRFNNYGELKYSLRSIAVYAPWVRNIYIITSTPNIKWLNFKNDKNKVFIVSHESIFPSKECLPNFNASAIETFIDKIPGLAEHFLYFNDDTFLGNNVSKSDFFTSDGRCRFGLKDNYYYKEKENFGSPRLYQPQKTEYAISLIKKKYNKTKIYLPMHQVRPMLKSVFSSCKRDFSQECMETAMNKFRAANDISLVNIIFPSYAIYNNYGVASNKLVLSNAFILFSDDIKFNELKFGRLLEKKPKLFCLGDDTSHYNKEANKQIQYYLDRYFPQKSEFEV